MSKTHVKVSALAATLVFGMIAAFSLAASPAHAQSLTLTGFNITVTNAPHVITIDDDGTDCAITTPTTNCGASVFGGAVDNALILFNLALYALDTHFAVNSITVHLPDLNPSCLFTLAGAKLINLNGAESFGFLGTVGNYSVTNCSLLIGAAVSLALGSSPSAAHISASMTTSH